MIRCSRIGLASVLTSTKSQESTYELAGGAPTRRSHHPLHTWHVYATALLRSWASHSVANCGVSSGGLHEPSSLFCQCSLKGCFEIDGGLGLERQGDHGDRTLYFLRSVLLVYPPRPIPPSPLRSRISETSIQQVGIHLRYHLDSRFCVGEATPDDSPRRDRCPGSANTLPPRV